MKKRVVVTGIGTLNPLGYELNNAWNRLIHGHCGLSNITGLEHSVKVHGCCPVGENENEINLKQYLGKNARDYSNFIQYALYASDEALKNANLATKCTISSTSSNSSSSSSSSSIDYTRAGVAIATGGLGSLQDIVETSQRLESKKRISPYFVPKILCNMAAGQVSIRHGFQGPLHSVATACAAGAHAIGDAYNFIRLGYADVMLTGGSESNLHHLSYEGFHSLRALSLSSNPLTASRPFDSTRNGFIIAEGACILVLEELNHALERNAPIIAEITGYGLSADAYHTTSPTLDGEGAVRSMKCALRDAQLDSREIGYINAHATSTPLGDNIEVTAIETVFGQKNNNHNNKIQNDLNSSTATTIITSNNDNNDSNDSIRSVLNPLYVSSTKGATGHLLGAAGALETAFCCLAIRDQIIPPTINLHTPDIIPTCFQHVPLMGIYYSTGAPVASKSSETVSSSNTYTTTTTDSCNNDSSMSSPSPPPISTTTTTNNTTTSNNNSNRVLRHVLKNSFGFGGTNASLIISQYIP